MIRSKKGKTKMRGTPTELKADLAIIFKNFFHIFGIKNTKKIVNEMLLMVEADENKETIKKAINKDMPKEIYDILEGLI